MRETCVPPFDTAGRGDPGSRLSWGVNLDRNFSIGSIFDGFAGASTTCTSDVYAGPFELSEPETRTIQFLANTFPNIKFAADVDSTGGFVVWPAGAYKDSGRVALPGVGFATDALLSSDDEGDALGAEGVPRHRLRARSDRTGDRHPARLDGRQQRRRAVLQPWHPRAPAPVWRRHLLDHLDDLEHRNARRSTARLRERGTSSGPGMRGRALRSARIRPVVRPRHGCASHPRGPRFERLGGADLGRLHDG